MVQYFSRLHADDDAEILGCIKEGVDRVQYGGVLRVSEEDAVLSKQHLSDELMGGFRACEETPKFAQRNLGQK